VSDPIVVVREPTVVQVVRDPGVVTVASAGVQGEPGPQGPVGGSGLMAYEYSTSTPAMLHQIQHNLTFKPNVTCRESGHLIEPSDVTHPASGITEVSFGVPVAVSITLS
jgi:hypothetical protein